MTSTVRNAVPEAITVRQLLAHQGVAVGQTPPLRDLLHLLEDLRDAYVGPAEETILTEIVANSLDSGASTIAVTTDPAQAPTTTPNRRTATRSHATFSGPYVASVTSSVSGNAPR